MISTSLRARLCASNSTRSVKKPEPTRTANRSCRQLLQLGRGEKQIRLDRDLLH
ncbi:MAG: hypothetical protein E5X08_13520, partial [Mesorhizobium sp.]